jgi:rRNA maturation endonuclease Nob1
LDNTVEIIAAVCGILLLIIFLYFLAFMAFAKKMKMLARNSQLKMQVDEKGTVKDVKQCPQCGNVVVDEYGFCPRCGTDLVEPKQDA